MSRLPLRNAEQSSSGILPESSHRPPAFGSGLRDNDSASPLSFMRSLRRIFLLVAALACFAAIPAHAAVPTPEEFAKRYQEARAAFDGKDYTRAQYLSDALLRDSIAQGKLSPQLFQLLGHTRYRQGDLGRAALWYMRATLFPPPSPETVQNLAHIHGKTGNLSFSNNRMTDQYTSWLTRPQWMRIVIASAWVMVFSLVLFFLVRFPGSRTIFMFTTILALVVGGLGCTGWKLRPTYAEVKDLAVVTAPNTQSYTSATTTAGKVIPLPPGSQVRKLEDRGAWSYIETWREESAGTGQMYRGWVQNSAISPFWPFDATYLE